MIEKWAREAFSHTFKSLLVFVPWGGTKKGFGTKQKEETQNSRQPHLHTHKMDHKKRKSGARGATHAKKAKSKENGFKGRADVDESVGFGVGTSESRVHV